MAQQQQETEKTVWPELVGQTFDEAKTAIKAYNSGLDVKEVPEGSMVTMDYRTDRVRVFVNPERVVVKPAPTIG